MMKDKPIVCEDQVDDRMNAQVCTDTVQVDGKKSVMVPTDVAQAQVDSGRLPGHIGQDPLLQADLEHGDRNFTPHGCWQSIPDFCCSVHEP